MKIQKRVLFFNAEIPVIANQLEAMLYFYSPSREYYIDRLSLTDRVCDALHPDIYHQQKIFIAPCCHTKNEMFFSNLTMLLLILINFKRIYFS
jgi:hypothetical protein